MKFRLSYIALSDILANGVVIMLILIVISLTIKQRDVDNELEQIDEIGVVMSREIANTLILNSLPSSSPAILHSYDHPRDLSVPHIIMGRDFVRIKSDGSTEDINIDVGHRELLLQQNKLDELMQALVAQKKDYIRLDILHTKNYYIVMSILKKHNIRVRDWHFLGNISNNNEGGEQINNLTRTAPKPSKSLFDFGDGVNDTPVKRNNLIEFISDDFFISPNGSGLGGLGGLGGSPNANKPQKREGSLDTTMESVLSRLGLAKGTTNNAFIKNLEINFADGTALKIADIIAPSDQISNDTPLAKIFLMQLFSFLTQKQLQLQAGIFVEITPQDFKAHNITDAYKQYETTIDNLYDSSIAHERNKIDITIFQSNSATATTLYNEHIHAITLTQASTPTLTADNNFTLQLYPRTTISRSKDIVLNHSDIILFANIIYTGEYDFIPVAIIGRNLTKIELGFLTSHKHNNQLVIDSRSNMKLDNIPLTDSIQNKPKTRNLQYIALVFIIILFLFLLRKVRYYEKN